MKIRIALGVMASLSAAVPASAQQFHPSSNPEISADDMERLKAFILRFDPAAFHYPTQVSVNGQIRDVRQPARNMCTTNPDIDALAAYRNAQFLTEDQRNVIAAALQGSIICRSPFAGVSNPFGRVPQGIPLTSLRSILGRKAIVVDYRLATPAQREGCTQASSRPLPRFTPNYTFMPAYRIEGHMSYDIAPNGVVHNVAMLETYRGAHLRHPMDFASAALTAAVNTRYMPPTINGLPAYCINVTERVVKIGDGNGGVSSARMLTPVFGTIQQ